MNAAGLSGATATAAATQPRAKKTLTQEDFLSLLLAQMKFQDPLSPLDNSQMAAQMAQLGTIEGINKLTQSMDVMSAYQASTAHLQAASLIGKRVEAVGNRLVLQQGSSSGGSYQLSRPGRVSIEIYDGKGTMVRTIDAGQKDTAKQRFTWDGKNLLGEAVSSGTYTFSVKALDLKGDSIAVSSSMTGDVSGITFENGMTYVSIGSERVALSDVFAILDRRE